MIAMVENISYKLCTCDLCKKQEKISDSCLLPTLWERVMLSQKPVDMCGMCFKTLENFLEDVASGKRSIDEIKR